MKYYKCINEEGWRDSYKEGVIYPENYHEFTIKQVRIYSNDFEEVSRLEYIKQQGWYIEGGLEFKKWLDVNKDKINKGLFDGSDTDIYYYLDDNKCLKTEYYEDVPKEKIQVNIEELDQLYNTNQTNKNKSMFKPGDKIVILDTSLYNDYDNRVRTITITNKSYNFDWECDQSRVNSNNIRHATSEEIKIGHKLNDNKSTKMENFQVIVTEHTFPILQDLALSNGYKWATGDTISYENHMKCILFTTLYKTIHYSRFVDSEDAYLLISLEEAIERICNEEPKEGDWVYFHGGNDGMVTDHWKKGIVGKIEKIETVVEKYIGSGKIVTLHDFDGTNDITGFRKATEDEIKNKLIEIAKQKGFPCKKWTFGNSNYTNKNLKSDWEYSEERLKLQCGTVYYNGEWGVPAKDTTNAFGYRVIETSDGNYQFGCENHIYTRAELHRFVRTLVHVNNNVTVKELRDKLKELIDL